MKVRFKDVICMGNKTYSSDDTADVSDITGQQLIDNGYADVVVADDEPEVKPKPAKKPATKNE